jgi:hypothetical protein
MKAQLLHLTQGTQSTRKGIKKRQMSCMNTKSDNISMTWSHEGTQGLEVRHSGHRVQMKLGKKF